MALRISISTKIRTTLKVFQDQGIQGIITVLRTKKSGLSRRLQRWWGHEDHWWVGKWLEIRGNKAEIDGCIFSIDTPYLSTSLKSRFALDRYEKPERQALQFLPTMLPVVELGAGIGVVSCLANKRLAHPEQHYVIEANPFLLPLLYKNRILNQSAFTILHGAISYSGNQQELFLERNFTDSNTIRSGSQTIKVPSVSLGEIAKRYRLNEFSLICDIEGAEFAMVENEADYISHAIRFIICETHPFILGEDRVASMLELLKSMGFTIDWLSRKTFMGIKE